MIKLFVSIPYTDYGEEEIREMCWKAVENTRELFPQETVILIDGNAGYAPEGISPNRWKNGRHLIALAKADFVYFPEGWDPMHNEDYGLVCRNEINCIVETEKVYSICIRKKGNNGQQGNRCVSPLQGTHGAGGL